MRTLQLTDRVHKLLYSAYEIPITEVNLAHRGAGFSLVAQSHSFARLGQKPGVARYSLPKGDRPTAPQTAPGPGLAHRPARRRPRPPRVPCLPLVLATTQGVF